MESVGWGGVGWVALVLICALFSLAAAHRCSVSILFLFSYLFFLLFTFCLCKVHRRLLLHGGTVSLNSSRSSFAMLSHSPTHLYFPSSYQPFLFFSLFDLPLSCPFCPYLLSYLLSYHTILLFFQVLEMTGIWPAHTNVEKYIMGLRDKFPVEVREGLLRGFICSIQLNLNTLSLFSISDG